jgi:DNA polymerase-3 subunit gamma/tau
MTGKLVGCNNGVVEIFYDNQYSFNKQRLEKEDNRRTVEEIFADVLNERVKLKYLLEAEKEEDISTEKRLIETFGEDMLEIIDE